jgi:hypothetical protein
MIKPHLRQLSGTLIQFAGVSLVAFGVGGPLLWYMLELNAMYKGATPGLLPILKQSVITLSGVVLSIVGASFFRAGKKARNLPAAELLMRDKRAPVLYLRSFYFDDVAAEKTITRREFSGPMLPFVVPEMKLSTYEGILTGILKKIGPCIAVGPPGRARPILGFSRLGLAEDSWQVAVKQLMTEAALVLICSGRTPGVRWELEQAAELIQPEKLVILITSRTTESWWEMADSLFRKKLPRIDSATEYIFSGIITFDQHGTPRGDQLVYYEKEQASIENSLKDAFKPILIRFEPSVGGH